MQKTWFKEGESMLKSAEGLEARGRDWKERRLRMGNRAKEDGMRPTRVLKPRKGLAEVRILVAGGAIERFQNARRKEKNEGGGNIAGEKTNVGKTQRSTSWCFWQTVRIISRKVWRESSEERKKEVGTAGWRMDHVQSKNCEKKPGLTETQQTE